MRKVEIRAPQVYRYRSGKSPEWIYSVAGVPAGQAERLFESVGQRGISVSFTGTDMVLPPFNVHDVGAGERAVALAMSAANLGGGGIGA